MKIIQLSKSTLFQKLLLTLLFLLLIKSTIAQLTLDSTINAQNLVSDVLVGSGVSVSNVHFTGANISIGKFSNGASTNIGINGGILLSTGNINNAKGPNLLPNKTSNTMQFSDPQLAALVPGLTIYDAAVLEFDFVPQSDTLKFRYVFASDEFPEWVNTGYNDVFGFFVSGLNPLGGNYSFHNIATVPGTSIPVSINTINNGSLLNGPCVNCTFYVNNLSGTTIEYDGFTKVLTSWILVSPCTNYHIKIAIGDVGDHAYDSGVFLEESSFSASTPSITNFYDNVGGNNFPIEGCANGKILFKLPQVAAIPQVFKYVIGGTAINGIDYLSIPDSVVIPAGSDSVILYINPLTDTLFEGQETISLIVKTSLCDFDTILIPIIDYQPMQLKILGDTVLCASESTILNAYNQGGIAPYTYVWNTNLTTPSIVVNPNQSENYWLTITDVCLNTSVDSTYILIHPLPEVEISTNSNHFCEGISTIIKATGANQYSWSPNVGLSIATGDSIIATPLISEIYHVLGTDLYGCKDSAHLSLTVLLAPSISINSSVPFICIGDSLTLTASGGINYDWGTTSFLSSNTGSTVIAKPTTTSLIKVIGTGNNGCIDSSEINCDVKGLPNLQIAPANAAICMGESINLIATGATNYIWEPSIGLSNTTSSNTIANPVSNVNYFIHGVDSFGCKKRDSVFIKVHSLPSVNVNPNSYTLCFKDSVELHASGGMSYVWLPNYAITQNLQSSVRVFPHATTTYMVLGTDSNGCKDTGLAYISISSLPSISPVSTNLCYGNTATLYASSSSASSSYIWNTGANTQNIAVSPQITTTFTVTVTDSLGCSSDTTAVVEVKPLPSILINPTNPNVCKGQNIAVLASGANTFEWAPENGISSQGSILTENLDSSKNYTLIGYSSFGCIDSLNFTISVNLFPPLHLFPHDTTICPNTNLSLIAQGGTTYSWIPNVGQLSNLGDTLVVSPNSSTKFVVSSSSIFGCTSKDSTTISVSPTASINSQFAQICVGDSIKLNAITNGTSVTYLWSTGNTSSFIWVKPSITNTYSVTITDTIRQCASIASKTIIVNDRPNLNVSPSSAILCSNESIVLTASGALTYKWSPTVNLSSSTVSSVTANPTVSTTYQVIGKGLSGCVDTVYTNITVIPSVLAILNPNISTICKNDSVKLIASGGINYQWLTDTNYLSNSSPTIWAKPTYSTTYKVIVSEIDKCSDTLLASVIVRPSFQVQSNIDSANLCKGDSIQLNVQGANTYTWTPTVGLFSNNSSQVIASPLLNTNYTIIGNDGYGCKDSIEIYVAIHYDELIINPSFKEICPHDSVLIHLEGGSQYNWFPSPLWQDGSHSNVIVNPTISTNYQVIGKNHFGCNDTTFSQIVVSPNPIITISTPNFCIGDTATLSVSTLSGQPSYLWNTGTMNDSIKVSPDSTTTFQVIATDTGGCVVEVSFNLMVHALPKIIVNPNFPSICQGSAIGLFASGASNYSWSPSIGLSSTSGAITSASPPFPTTYTVLGIDSFGCKDTSIFDITFYPNPTLTTNINSDTICQGDSILLIGFGCSNYNWSTQSTPSIWTNDSFWVKPSVSTLFQLIGSNEIFCNDTSYINICVIEPSIITASDSNVCAGSSTNLTVSTPIQGTSFVWNTGETTSSITVYPYAQTTYSVISSFSNVCNLVSILIINVDTESLVSITNVNNQLCYGDSLLLNATNCLTYNWNLTIGLSSDTGSSVFVSPTSTTLFQVRGTNANGCESKDSIVINIIPKPTIVASPSSTFLCKNDSIEILVSGGQSYVWTPTNNLFNINNFTVMAKPLTNQIYSVKGTDSNGCTNISQVNIQVDPGPNVLINPNNPYICQGDTIHLIASGAINYSWYPNLWQLYSNGPNFTVQPLANISYHVIGTNANGCSNDTSIYINVKRQPQISVNPNVISICLGDSTNITAYGADNYTWTSNISSDQLSGSAINVNPVVSTTYTVKGMSTDGCYKSTTAEISIKPLPVLSVIANPVSICVGDTAVLNVSSNIVQTSYLWNTGQLGSIQNQSPTITSVYTVTATTSFGCVDSISKTIIVNDLPIVHVSPSFKEICSGHQALLTANSNHPSQFLWNNGSVLPTINPTLTSSTTFFVSVTDTNQCKNDTSVTVVVFNNPNVQISKAKDSICFGDSLLLSAISPNSGLQFAWNTGNLQQNITVSPSLTTYFNVDVTDSNGCINSDTTNVIVRQLPVLTISTNKNEMCYGDSVSMNVVSNTSPISYVWSNGDTSGFQIVHPTNTITYFVTATDNMGCKNSSNKSITINQLPLISITPSLTKICRGNSILLTALSNYPSTFEWNTGGTFSYNLQSPNQTSTYTVTVTDNNLCKSDTSVYVEVVDNPIVEILQYSDSVCEGDSIMLFSQSTSTIQSYLWSNGNTDPFLTVQPLSSTTFILIIEDTNGCIGKDSVQVQVKFRPTCNLTAISPICSNDSSIIEYTGNASNNAIVNWGFAGGTKIYGMGIGQHAVKWTNSGDYAVTLSVTQNGCSSIPDTAIVKVNLSPVADFELVNDIVCKNQRVNFNSLNHSMNNYSWDFGDFYTLNDSSSLQNPFYSYSHLGAYTVFLSVVDNNGCYDDTTKSHFIKPNTVPVADFKPYPQKATLNNPKVNFLNISSDSTHFFWDFNDPNSLFNSSTVENPFHVYQDTGIYWVQLIAINTYGCADTVIKPIKIENDIDLFIPTAFSPNGDGINDYFFPLGINFDWGTYKIIVFNRWGSIVHEACEQFPGWNGNYQNQSNQCATEVYTYLITIKDLKGLPHRFVGKVTIVR